MRTVKPIKKQIKKLKLKLEGKARKGVEDEAGNSVSTLQVDSSGNSYRIVDGRRELVNVEALKAEIKRQEQAIITVQTRGKRLKKPVVVPSQKKDKKSKAK